MTIKEIMELTGLSRDTIRREINRTFPGLSKKGKTTKLDEKQAIEIVGNLKKSGFITPAQNKQVPTQNADVAVITDIRLLSVSIAEIAQSVNNLAAGINGIVQNQDIRISRLENKFKKRIDALPAPQISIRNAINKIVREKAEKTGADYQDVWHLLYTDFAYRMSRNFTVCAKNRNMKTIDYIESEGFLGELLATAREIF